MRAKSFIQTGNYVTLFVFLLAFLPAVYCAKLDELFRIKKGTDKGGADGRTDILQKWLDDTETLVNALLPVLPENPAAVDVNDADLARNLQAYFKIRINKSKGGINGQDIEKYTALREKFTNLDAFLKRQNPKWLGGDEENQIPWLFVNSDWQEETELYFNANGDAIDEGGDVIMGDASGARQANLRNWNPPNFDNLAQDAKDLFIDMKKGSAPDWEKYAYWSSDIKDYSILDAKDRYLEGGFCNHKGKGDFFALTIDNLYADSITICDVAFTEKAEKHETIADGLASSQAKDENDETPLQDTAPRGLTLFHELIHMTTGADDTPDAGTKPTQCLPLSGNNAVKNPDSIAYFSWSYYLSKNGDPKYQWHTGFQAKPK